MPREDQRQKDQRVGLLQCPNSTDDTDAIVELSLKLAKAAKKRWPLRR